MKASKVTANVAIEGRPTPCDLDELSGTEALSELFSFELTFGLEAPLDLAAVVGKSAVVTIEVSGEIRHMHGRVAHVEEIDGPTEQHRYRTTLRPDAWHLTERVDCRIFQSATAPEVLARVFRDAGVERVRFALRRSYERRDLCVQYRETDWAFASRLMEDEGIFHFFEHAEDGHTWVIADDASANRDAGVGTLAWVPPGGALDGGGTGIESIRLERTVRPGRVAVRGLGFDATAVPADAEATRDRIDLAHYEPGAPLRPGDRLEALQATRDVARGSARTTKLIAGGTFALDGHPRDATNRGWLATHVDHRLAHADGKPVTYGCTFTAIPDDVPYRPERRTPKPRIFGPQAADVVGPAGDEIHTDEAGRISVRMRWDRDTISHPCWVHVAQSMSGAGFGAMAIPRVGSAVLVGFLDGDPDQPVVTGRVYDQTRPYPYPLPAEKTKTGIVTRTTPGGDGHNELRFEDAAGREEVFLRAQRDLSVDVRHDRSATVAHDDALRVDGDRSATVVGLDTTTVGGNRSVTVDGELRETVALTAERHVSGNHVVAVVGDDQTRVGGSRLVTVEGSDTTTVTGTQSVSVSGNLQQIVDGQATQLFGALQVAVEGSTLIQSGSEVKLESSHSYKIGAPTIILSGNTVTIRAYEKIVLEVGNADVASDDRPRLEITSSGVYVTSGDAKEKLSGDIVRINC